MHVHNPMYIVVIVTKLGETLSFISYSYILSDGSVCIGNLSNLHCICTHSNAICLLSRILRAPAKLYMCLFEVNVVAKLIFQGEGRPDIVQFQLTQRMHIIQASMLSVHEYTVS